MANDQDDPVLQSSRREALAVFVTWLCAMTYTVSYCYVFGYDRPASELKFVHLFWGIAFPDWVFWGIVLPWSVCFVVSWWFSYVYVTDADLGEELDESDSRGESAAGERDA